MDSAKIDFQQLRIKHILFKSKVRSALYGGTVDPSFFTNAGPVNAWFDTIGLVRYANAPEVKELLRLQNELNAQASLLTLLYKQGKIEEAHDGFPKIESKSDQFLQIIAQAEQRMSG